MSTSLPNGSIKACLPHFNANAQILQERLYQQIQTGPTIHARLPAAQQQVISQRLTQALGAALERQSSAPIVQLLDDREIVPQACTFTDTQILLDMLRQQAFAVFKPFVGEHPADGWATLDFIATALSQAATREAGRFVVTAEEQTRDQSRLYEALRSQSERAEQGFLTSPLAAIEFDAEGRIVRWNPGASRIFGWDAAEVIGQNIVQLLVPDMVLEQVQPVVDALLQGEVRHSRNDNKTKDGHIVTCQWYNAVLRDADGRVTGVLSQIADVTDQLRTEQALRESEAGMRVLIENLPVILAIINADGIFTLSAGKGLKDVGLEPGQMIGASALELYKDRPDIAADLERGLAGESFIALHQYGDVMFESRYVPLYDANQQLAGTSILSINVTDRVQAENERTRLQEELIMAQEAILRELSTPIIPLSEGVIAMPLIGNIDRARAQMVLETLVEGVSLAQAETAILDITGVHVVDTQVADALLRAARAVKLLGAQVVLTGIRPEVAQTLVGLGLEMNGVVTRSTLQSGIAFALGRRSV